MSIRKRKCRLGKVKSGARKGLCRKVRPHSRRRSRRCPLGKVKFGQRKGRCRKVRVGTCKAYAPYSIGGKVQFRCYERAGAKHPEKRRPSPNLVGRPIPGAYYRAVMKQRKAAQKEAAKAARAARKAGGQSSGGWWFGINRG